VDDREVIPETSTAISGPPGPDPVTDEQRRRALRRMRTLATGLLVLAALIFLATLHADGAWGFVNAAAEAAMVGALADWFAVTALFKHPLGLPVPHTALVPRRKGELGRSLQAFVVEHFLTEQIARDRLAAFEASRRLGRWLGVAANRVRASGEIIDATRALLKRVPDEEVRTFTADVLAPKLAAEPMAQVAGELLEGVVCDGAHSGLVDLIAAEVHGWLTDNPGVFKAIVSDRAPWWTPAWVDEKVVDWSYSQALTWVGDIRDDPHHPTRLAFDTMLMRLADDLKSDPGVQARAEALKARLLTHPQVPESAVSLWQAGRKALLAMADDPNSGLYRRLDGWLDEAGRRLLADEALRVRLDGLLADGVAFVVRNHGNEIASAISHTIDGWDGRDAAQRIELHVGRDLQFIRINGTIVGALAGLLIHTVAVLLA
jgi:uncharacterized membrane-anchored protein YjiN (DUF445 family)